MWGNQLRFAVRAGQYAVRVGVLVVFAAGLSSGTVFARAETAISHAGAPPPADAAPAKPVFALRSRFSDRAGVVTFSAVKPRPARAAATPAHAGREPAGAAALAAGSAGTASGAAPGLGSVLIGGVPSARSGVRLTSGFGGRVDPFLGGSRLHAGLDLAAPYGSLVVARSPGVVIAAGWIGGYGNCVVIDHGGGVQTRYGHLAQIRVAAGQHVEPGSLLGLVGSTGRSTGPHLHYEVRVNGWAVNPLAR